ncbi:MAG: hypothetical protein KJ737_06040 [Proteobacteria bacterium]|nr:hypothetical protein [Pseudomonadota bacterium]
MSGIGVIFNPRAGKNRKNHNKLLKLEDILNGCGIVRETKTEEELTQAVLEFKENKFDLIAISGGDGTIHRVLSNVITHYGDAPLPRFMALRSGTMNTFTNSVKFKGKSADILSKTVLHYQTGQAFREIHQHLMKVNDKYGFMTGAGVVSNFLNTYYSSGNPGPVEAAKMVTRIILSTIFRTRFATDLFNQTRFKVTIDGAQVEQESFMFILGCTITELGLGFTPTPRAYEKPGHFHFIASTIKPFQLLPKVPALWLGKSISHPEFQHNGIAEEVIVEPEGKFQWMIDGDLYMTETPLHLSVGPTITVISPD